MEMTIRQATARDVDAICEVDARAFGSGPYAEFSDRHKPADWLEKRRAGTRARCEKQYVEIFVAEAGGRVVGYTQYTPPVDGVGAIHTNAVDPDWQGRGISTALVRRAVEELATIGARKVTVHTSHVPAAVCSYEKAGFREVRRSPGPNLNAWLEIDLRKGKN